MCECSFIAQVQVQCGKHIGCSILPYVYILFGGSAILQDLPRTLYHVLCFQLAERKRKRERGENENK